MTSTKHAGAALFAAAFIIIIAGLMYAASIITPLLLSFFISIVCAQPILWLQKKGVPQTLAILIIFVTIIVVFLGFGEIISSSISSFSKQAPQYEKNLQEMGASILQFLHDKGFKVSPEKMNKFLDPSRVMRLTANLLGQLGSIMGNALTIFFLVLFLLLELDSISVKVKAILRGTTDSIEYIKTIGDSIRHYLSIKTMTSLLTGILIWIILAIIGVDYAILWGLIAFLLNYIPNIGSIIAAVPAVLFSVIQLGMGGALGVAIVFVVVNLVIGNVVEPKLMGKGLGLSTFVVFFALIFWGFVLGTVGMFLSVPLTMAIKIMLEQNPKTKGIAIALGTQKDAQEILDQFQDPEKQDPF